MKVTSATIYWDSQDRLNEGWAFRVKGEDDREESGEWDTLLDVADVCVVSGIEDAVKALVYRYDDDRTEEIDSGAVAIDGLCGTWQREDNA